MSSIDIHTLLGKGSRFEGRLVFDGAVRIEGELRGEVRSEDTLIVAEGAELHAEIEVGTFIMRGGLLVGNVRARGAIELFAPARVVGNLHAPTITIEKGVEVEGLCKMGPLE